MSLQNKTILVTGAARGLGRAVTEAFLREGAHVVALSRDVTPLTASRETLASLGGSLQTVQADVCDEQAVADCVASLPSLDVVVNNAGIARARAFLDTPTSEISDILAVNVIGVFNVMREAARKMVPLGGGHIINVASDAALKGIPGMAPYVASKHAVLGLSRSVGKELRQQGVRVTCFCPGPIATDILGPSTANPRALSPVKLAQMIVHLATLPPDLELQELLVEPMGLNI